MTIDANKPQDAPINPSVFTDVPVGTSQTDEALGQYIVDKLKDGLSTAEKAAIEGFIEGAMSSPALPGPDQALLNKWLEMIKNAPTSAGSPVSGTDAIPEEGNPYMRPGIMAILAPIMAKLFPVEMDIIKSSAKLEVAMQGLVLEMAKCSYQATINAGDAKAKQLEIDRDKDFALAAMQFAQAGITFGMSAGFAAQKFAVSRGNLLGSKGKEDYEAAKLDDKVATQARLKEGSIEKDEAITSSQRAVLKEHRDDIRTSEQTATSVIGSLGQAGQSMVSGIAENEKIQYVKIEAMQNALKEFFDKLSQTLQTTAQKASEEQKSADQAWQNFSNLYKDFGKLVVDIWRA